MLKMKASKYPIVKLEKIQELEIRGLIMPLEREDFGSPYPYKWNRLHEELSDVTLSFWSKKKRRPLHIRVACRYTIYEDFEP